MPSIYYNRNFKPQYFYHIYNRGAYKHRIFKDSQDYNVFIEILAYYLKCPTAKHFSYKKLIKNPYIKVPNLCVDSVRLVTYCLMPNHFHFIFKQMPEAIKKTNISNLMRRLSITYAMYFQYKYQHTGALFESKYKNVKVDTNKQLLHLSKYIHKNPNKLTKNLENYAFSSLPNYLKQTKPINWLYPEYVLKLVNNYQKFIKSPTKKSNIKNLNKIKLD